MILFLKYWKFILAAIFLCASAVYVGSLRFKIENLESDKKLLETQIQLEKTRVSQLALSINEQNSAIDKLKSESNERLNKHKFELNRAKSDAVKYKTEVQKLINRSAPAGISSCVAAEQLIDQELKNAKK